MAGPFHRVPGDYAGGGSLALIRLLDEYGEEIYVDLLEHYRLNIVEFLAGTVQITPRLILTLLRNLPEGSRYAAAVTSAPEAAAVHQKRAEEAEADPVLDARTWNFDRLLMAQLINSINALVRHTIPWPKDGAPELPLVGPSSWRQGPKSKPLSVMDVLNKITGKHG